MPAASGLIKLEAAPRPDDVLCRLDDIDPDLGNLRLLWFDRDGQRRVFLLRRGDALFAYINECPHALSRLDHPPGDFLSLDRQRLECSFHGAQFEIDTGRCISGPCFGRGLTVYHVEVSDGEVRVARPTKPSTSG